MPSLRMVGFIPTPPMTPLYSAFGAVSQSLQLMDIVNKNQKEVNRLKQEQEKLKEVA
mgnify:CR=1 FL=1